MALQPLGARLGARQRNPLSRLVAPAAQLGAVRPRTNLVATPPPPPSLYRFGQQERGAPQSSAYTGGVVGSPYRPIENINTDFVSPTYAAAPLAGNAGAFPALAAIPGVGHGFPGSPSGGGSPGTSPPPPPRPPTPPGVTPPQPRTSPGGHQVAPPGTPRPTRVDQLPRIPATPGSGAPYGTSAYGPTLGQLLATAALRGTRIGGSYWQE